MNAEDKIKVFISSKLGGEKVNFDQLVVTSAKDKRDIAETAVKTSYDLIRRGLKTSLEATGLIQTYMFEEAPGSTLPAEQEYLYKLDVSDVCLFLIDNFDEKIPDGILKEIDRAKNSNKKSIFLFLNAPGREKTTIQQSKTGPAGSKYVDIDDLREFIDEGFRSVISDILTIYQMYCGGYLNPIDRDKSPIQVAKGNFPIDTADIDKQIFTKLEQTKNRLASLVNVSNPKAAPSSQLDGFCLSVLEVMLGEKDFRDIDLANLLEELKELQPAELHQLVGDRWRAIASLYSGDLEKAIAELNAIYDKYSGDPVTPKWLLNNILIDLRNLENIANLSKNAISFAPQQRISQQKSLIFFPLVDRFSINISDDIWDRHFNALTSSPFSRTFYNIDHLFGYISNYLLTAVYYGSYTHMLFTLKEIQKVLLELVEQENNLLHKIQLMRTSILLGDESNAEKVLAKYKSALSHSTAKEIVDMYKLAETKPTPYQTAVWKLLLFTELGYYFSDVDYEGISNEIISLSRQWIKDSNPNISLIEKFIKALKSNKDRVNQEAIVLFAMEVINKKHYRFLHSILELLQQIDFSAMPHELLSRLILEVTELLKDEKTGKDDLNVEHLLLRIRKSQSDFSTEIDELVEKYYSEFYKGDYHLETAPGEHTVHIGRYLESIKVRNKVQGKGGKFILYADNPYYTIRRIIEVDKISLPEALHGELLTAIAETLLSSTQSYSDKINSIQLLLCLKRQHLSFYYDWAGYYSNLKQNSEKIEMAHSDFFERDSALVLQLYMAITHATFGENSLQEMLEVLALINNGSDAEIIESLTALDDFLGVEKANLNNNRLIPSIVQYTSAYCFHNDDDIRYWTVPVLYQLIDTQYSDFVVKRLGRMMDDDAVKVKLVIINQAGLIKEHSVSTFNYILGKARIDNNYLVRRAIEKYPVDQKLEP